MSKRFTLQCLAASALLACAGGAFAQQSIRIANIVELSGAGATAGTNFKNGVELAVKEINAAGGILGKKIESVTSDTQSNPGVAKGLTQKAIDDDKNRFQTGAFENALRSWEVSSSPSNLQ